MRWARQGRRLRSSNPAEVIPLRARNGNDFPTTTDEELLAWSRDLVATEPAVAASVPARPRRTEPLRARRASSSMSAEEIFEEIQQRHRRSG